MLDKAVDFGPRVTSGSDMSPDVTAVPFHAKCPVAPGRTRKSNTRRDVEESVEGDGTDADTLRVALVVDSE